MAACSVAVLWFASVTPSGWLGLTAAAGLFPAAAVLAAGRSAGYFSWAASSVLALLLLPHKGSALLYAIFLGLYPVVKSRIESLRRLPLEWCLKLIYFNAALVVAWSLLREIFFPSAPSWASGRIWLVYLAGNLVFILYDIGLSRLITLVAARLPK